MTQFRKVWAYLTDEEAKELDEKYAVILKGPSLNKVIFFKYKGDPPTCSSNKMEKSK